MFPRLTTALGTGAVMLYQRDSGPDVTVVAAATPVIVLGPRLVEGVAPTPEVRAILARAADRAALLLDGDPATIARLAAARHEPTTHLVSAVAHAGWLPLRTKLGLGIR